MFSNTLIDSVNFELTKIVIWFQALPNKLSLNIKKANCVLFYAATTELLYSKSIAKQ